MFCLPWIFRISIYYFKYCIKTLIILITEFLGTSYTFCTQGNALSSYPSPAAMPFFLNRFRNLASRVTSLLSLPASLDTLSQSPLLISPHLLQPLNIQRWVWDFFSIYPPYLNNLIQTHGCTEHIWPEDSHVLSPAQTIPLNSLLGLPLSKWVWPYFSFQLTLKPFPATILCTAIKSNQILSVAQVKNFGVILI